MPTPSCSTLTTESNVATTWVGDDTVTVHTGSIPLHRPRQPVNADAESASAVSSIVDPTANEAVHVPPQSILVGDEETVPAPLPPRATVTG